MTDIAPSEASDVTRGQFSWALTTTPNDGFNHKYDYYVAIDITELAVPPPTIC